MGGQDVDSAEGIPDLPVLSYLHPTKQLHPNSTSSSSSSTWHPSAPGSPSSDSTAVTGAPICTSAKNRRQPPAPTPLRRPCPTPACSRRSAPAGGHRKPVSRGTTAARAGSGRVSYRGDAAARRHRRCWGWRRGRRCWTATLALFSCGRVHCWPWRW
jgi:hypothetical protein